MSVLTNVEVEFDALFQNLNGKSERPYHQIRKEAFESYKQLGIPTVKHEDWKYANLKGLEKHNFQRATEVNVIAEDLSALPFSTLKGISLVFVNGNFVPELSSDLHNESIKVLDFKQAESEIPEILNQHYGKAVDFQKEGLSALNVAFAQQGAVVYVPANSTLEEPVLIKHINDSRNLEAFNAIHHLTVVDKNAEVKLVEIFQNVGEQAAFTNAVSEIFVAEDARVDYYKIQDENDASYHVGTTQVVQKDKSYFYAATVTVNGGFVRNNLNLVLDGEYIESHMYGLYIPNGNQLVDNHTLVDHRKPNSESNELYKGILDGKSKGVFNGKIYVQQDAQKTNAYQNCRNVILSDSASMNTKPQLEIWADDVKCSHGTTTGKLDEEAIFYMQSRGIPKAEAVKLQLAAFAEDVVSQFKWETLREELDVLILQKLQA